ncbi:formyl transferase [Jimgerdemannia flammicorona]|uniref:methionyl-tRNA formyltransferase n=1 Tax=Jimgerdemannia flammicorona TaxID=994334 RepID=A0A433PCP5_9FUNG|nr:formyl transferase [Jimgerdemannia flammicorona]
MLSIAKSLAKGPQPKWDFYLFYFPCQLASTRYLCASIATRAPSKAINTRAPSKAIDTRAPSKAIDTRAPSKAQPASPIPKTTPIVHDPRNRPRYRILFFGSDNFAVKHLAALIKEKERSESVIRSIEVVTPPDRRTGRKLKEISPMPTKALAELHDLAVHHTPSYTPPGIHSLAEWNLPLPADVSSTGFDLGVVVSFGYFLPPHILHAFPKGVINVHPSLLPKYRGAAPMQHTIMNGDVKTGVTVQELDEKEFDAGKILLQEEWVDKPIMFDSLAGALGLKGAALLVKTLRNYDVYKENATMQDTTQVTHAPKITKDMAFIDFETMPAETIERLHRAIGHQVAIVV